MRRRSHLLIAVFVAALGVPLAAAAQTVDMTREQALAQLQKAGYTDVQGLSPSEDEDHYRARATKDGKPVDVDVDARSGVITLKTSERSNQSTGYPPAPRIPVHPPEQSPMRPPMQNQSPGDQPPPP